MLPSALRQLNSSSLIVFIESLSRLRQSSLRIPVGNKLRWLTQRHYVIIRAGIPAQFRIDFSSKPAEGENVTSEFLGTDYSLLPVHTAWRGAL